MKNLAISGCLLITLAILSPAPATADCWIGGHIGVEDSDNPLGAYRYTLSVTWDMDSPHGLSHLDLLVDGEGGTCSCADFGEAIAFDTIAGTSDGEYGCMVDYYAELACNGDPSIGLGGILFKFEPVEGDCEPGPTGSGSFEFYSNLPPVPVNEQVLALVDKASNDICSGTLTGVFPGMACDPVSSEGVSLDNLKGLYR